MFSFEPRPGIEGGKGWGKYSLGIYSTYRLGLGAIARLRLFESDSLVVKGLDPPSRFRTIS